MKTRKEKQKNSDYSLHRKLTLKVRIFDNFYSTDRKIFFNGLKGMPNRMCDNVP